MSFYAVNVLVAMQEAKTTHLLSFAESNLPMLTMSSLLSYHTEAK